MNKVLKFFSTFHKKNWGDVQYLFIQDEYEPPLKLRYTPYRILNQCLIKRSDEIKVEMMFRPTVEDDIHQNAVPDFVLVRIAKEGTKRPKGLPTEKSGW